MPWVTAMSITARGRRRFRALDDAGVRCEQIACGGDHTLAIAGGGSGVLLAWGRGSSGPAGTGATTDVLTPTIIDRALLGDEKVFQISAGSKHSVAVTEGGCVYTWGARTQGQLGHGSAMQGNLGARSGNSRRVGARLSLPSRKSRVFPPDATFCTPSQLETTRLRLWRLAKGQPRRVAERRGLVLTDGHSEPSTSSILELAESITALDPEVDADECHRIVPELIRAVEDVFSSPGSSSRGSRLHASLKKVRAMLVPRAWT